MGEFSESLSRVILLHHPGARRVHGNIPPRACTCACVRVRACACARWGGEITKSPKAWRKSVSPRDAKVTSLIKRWHRDREGGGGEMVGWTDGWVGKVGVGGGGGGRLRDGSCDITLALIKWGNGAQGTSSATRGKLLVPLKDAQKGKKKEREEEEVEEEDEASFAASPKKNPELMD